MSKISIIIINQYSTHNDLDVFRINWHDCKICLGTSLILLGLGLGIRYNK